MSKLKLALSQHGENLEQARLKAEQLDDALAGGQNLRKVVAASRILRQDLADMHAQFKVLVSRPLAPGFRRSQCIMRYSKYLWT